MGFGESFWANLVKVMQVKNVRKVLNVLVVISVLKMVRILYVALADMMCIFILLFNRANNDSMQYLIQN